VEEPEDAPRIRGYRLLATLGSGGIGTVYKAVHVASRRVVALKVLPFCEGTDQNVTCLLRETQVAARLQHPNIIRGLGAGVDGGYFYTAMEYVEGETLADLLEHQGALPEDRALQITRQIMGALAHAWAAGLVHRDVKPDNIMLTKDGVPKLADLGTTRDLTGLLNTISSEGMVVGTPLYISPEQAQGMGGVDWRADVYGLGATLYHMVCGTPPFDRNLGTTTLLFKHVSEDPIPAYLRRMSVSIHVSRLIGMMMQKDREKRHTSPGELMADLVRVTHGLPPEFAASMPMRGKQEQAGLS
jgi:serine/threonine-protein kinase